MSAFRFVAVPTWKSRIQIQTILNRFILSWRKHTGAFLECNLNMDMRPPTQSQKTILAVVL